MFVTDNIEEDEESDDRDATDSSHLSIVIVRLGFVIFARSLCFSPCFVLAVDRNETLDNDDSDGRDVIVASSSSHVHAGLMHLLDFVEIFIVVDSSKPNNFVSFSAIVPT